MPIYEGKKWACSRCIQGHRVRTCNHADRELLHVRDKGRPVTQCKTCRKSRQSNGAHAKCDCGRWTAKCEHLSTASHRHTCCCNHDGVCTCCSSKTNIKVDSVGHSDSDQEARAPAIVPGCRSSTSSKPRVPITVRHHKSRVRPHETSGPYTLSRGNSNNSMSSQEDLGDKSWISPHDLEGQHLARSETPSPLMTAIPSIQQAAMPLRVNVSEDWAFPVFQECSDGLFGDVEQPIISASLSAEPVNWYSLPFTAFPAETTIGDASIDSSRHSVLTLSSEDQVGLEAVPGLGIETLNENYQQNMLFQQPSMPVPLETTDFFAEAWEPQEYAMDANLDLNDLNRDPFFQ